MGDKLQRDSSILPIVTNNVKHMQKSRTMMEIRVPVNIQLMAKDILIGSNHSLKTEQKIDDLEETITKNKGGDEQMFEENNKLMAQLTNVRSKSTDLSELNIQNDIGTNIRF